MWNIYFGDWSNGRLKRLPYLGYDVLLMVLAFAIVMGVIMLGGGFEGIMNPDLLAGMGVVVVIFFFLFFIALLVANLNIMAKRLRDMGLPAWKSVIAIIVISVILEILFPAQQMEMSAVAVNAPEGANVAMDMNASEGSIVSNIFNLIVFLCLVLIPSDTFNKNKEETEA